MASETKEYSDEPIMFNDAWFYPNKIEQKGWRYAIIKEFDVMTKRKVWERIKRDQVPKDRRTIGSKWVFKRKRDGTCSARLCGLSYTQIARIDFTTHFLG